MTRPSIVAGAFVLVSLFVLMGAAPPAIAAEYATGKQSIMMFPMKTSLGADKAQMGHDLVILIKEGLSITGRFMVMDYDFNSNVSIQRAVTEQKIKDDDARTAFSTDAQGLARARKVCKAIAVDLGITGSLDSYTFDPGTKEAKIGVTVQLVKNDDSEPVTIVVTGTAAGKPDDASQTENGIAVAALDNAADKVLTQLLDATLVSAPETPTQNQVYVPASKPKSNNRGLMTAMLGALLLGLALGGN